MWTIQVILGLFVIALIILAMTMAEQKKSYLSDTEEEKSKIEKANKDNLATAKWLARGAVIIVVLMYLLTSLVTVSAGQVGVVTRFGAITGRELGPGISFKAPFPFEGVSKLDTRVQKQEAEATAASNDLQDVKGNIAVNWHLERGKVSEIYQRVGLDFEQKLLQPAIQESFKATTAQYTAQDLIKRRGEVGIKATEILNDKLQSYGITIDSVNIVNLEFSKVFTEAIEQSQVAQQQVVKATNDLERVKKEAESKIAQAQGEAEAQRQQAASITEEYLRLKTIEKWNGVYPSTVAGDSSSFILPLK